METGTVDAEHRLPEASSDSEAACFDDAGRGEAGGDACPSHHDDASSD
jgi:hypothetical protein